MVGHGGSSAGSYLADPTSRIPSNCASIVATSTVRAKEVLLEPDQFGEVCTIVSLQSINYYIFGLSMT